MHCGVSVRFLLKDFMNCFFEKLIGVEVARLLRDEWAGEITLLQSDKGAHRTPRGKRVTATEINRLQRHRTL
ncbi:hypothetical protein J2X07_002888 [Fictibacillus barbaricus]|uniref:Transposase n=1 Tax=Fictibacillus barbaricus TaxID=182136 RepID=A0ABU1U329_9BACL|nr:hypothetical protein [Fictibacillus barbaricus]